MSEADRKRWDERHAEGGHRSVADPWMLEQLADRKTGRLLDVAAGRGALALEATVMGFSVCAVDISRIALDDLEAEARHRGLAIETRTADLDDITALAGLAPFDLLTISRYKPTPLQWQNIAPALKDGGHLLVCSFSDRQQSMRPAFRLNRECLKAELEPLGFSLKVWQDLERDENFMAGSVWVKGELSWSREFRQRVKVYSSERDVRKNEQATPVHG